MTTTIYDTVSKQVASDTRWSSKVTLSDGNDYFVYVDDSGFDKIADRENTVLVLAGNGPLIAKWKEWWYTSLDTNNLPETDIDGENVVNLMIVDKSNNEILFDAGQKKALFCELSSVMLSVFAGSGDIHAASCWSLNRCVNTAIVSASMLDYSTSSVVRYVDFTNGNSNISKMDYNYSSIVNAIMDRGFIMNLSESTAANDVGTPLNQHQIKDEINTLFTNGNAVASAPVPGMSTFKWSDKNKEKLVSAINKVKELENI